MDQIIVKLRKHLLNRSTRRAIVSLIVFVVLWELGSRSKQWLGTPLPWVGKVPAPSAVLHVWAGLLTDPGYWQSWYLSLFRVLAGFAAAMLIGIPFGLLMAVSKTSTACGSRASRCCGRSRRSPGCRWRSSSGP